MPPKILVLGAGSIGRRHAGNLVAAGADVRVADPDPDRLLDLPQGAAPQAVVARSADLKGFEGVVVASPSNMHAQQARWGIDAAVPVLVEKPLATRLEDAELLLVAAGAVPVMVAYNLRYFEPVQAAISYVKEGHVGDVLRARFWFGSYLPDWRPGTDYRTTYSARRELGGGVLHDAIHELDLVTWLFTDPLEIIGATLQNSGQLEVDVEDMATALLTTPDGIPIEVALDYLSRRYRRGFEIVGTDATLTLDWSRQELTIASADGVESRKGLEWDIARSYEIEAQTFLRVVVGDCDPPVDLRGGLRSLALAERIREVAGWT